MIAENPIRISLRRRCLDPHVSLIECLKSHQNRSGGSRIGLAVDLTSQVIRCTIRVERVPQIIVPPYITVPAGLATAEPVSHCRGVSCECSITVHCRRRANIRDPV